MGHYIAVWDFWAYTRLRRNSEAFFWHAYNAFSFFFSFFSFTNKALTRFSSKPPDQGMLSFFFHKQGTSFHRHLLIKECLEWTMQAYPFIHSILYSFFEYTNLFKFVWPVMIFLIISSTFIKHMLSEVPSAKYFNF